MPKITLGEMQGLGLNWSFMKLEAVLLVTERRGHPIPWKRLKNTKVGVSWWGWGAKKRDTKDIPGVREHIVLMDQGYFLAKENDRAC